MACRLMKNWKSGNFKYEEVGDVKIPLNYFSCGELLFDGLFNVVRFPKGMKFYHGEISPNEFAVGEEFYRPVENPDETLPSGLTDLVAATDYPITRALAMFIPTSSGWYADPRIAKKVCVDCVSVYELTADANFIRMNNGYNVWKFLNLPDVPVDIKTRLRQLNPGTPELAEAENGYILDFPKLVPSEEFLLWVCKEADRAHYAGYSINSRIKLDTPPEIHNEFIFCRAMDYLQRDLTDQIDWQHQLDVGGVIQEFIKQMKLYKTTNINSHAGNLYEHSIWSVLHLEDILATPNQYATFNNNQKRLMVATAFIHNIGKMDPSEMLIRKNDCVYFKMPGSAENGVKYLSGEKDLPILSVVDSKITREGSFPLKNLLVALGISLGDVSDVSDIIQHHTMFKKRLAQYTSDRSGAIDGFIKDIGGTSLSVSYVYALLAVSVSDLLASQPHANPRQKSTYFPFISNVPKKYRGGRLNVNLQPFGDDILRRFAPLPNPVTISPAVLVPVQIQQEGEMWYKDRIIIGKAISKKLEGVEVSQWKKCLSGEDADDFKAKLGTVKILGRGTFGQVYLTSIDVGSGPMQKIVVKEAMLSGDEKDRMAPHTKGGFPQNSWPDEFKMISFTKDLLEAKRTPNFLNIYHLSACDGCNITTLVGSSRGVCYSTFMEAANGDINNFKGELTSEDDQKCLIFQMLIAIHLLQKEYGMVHNDIKSVNVMVQKTPQLAGKYFRYVIRGRDYFIKNPGWVFYLADFGVADMFKPEWSLNGVYGERNAKVLASGDLLPFETEFFYYKKDPNASTYLRIPSPKMKWKNGSGTRNRFIKERDAESDIGVDLSNTEVFPVWQFYGDIQDILRMVVGGKQTVQASYHEGLENPQAIKDLLAPVVTTKNFWEIEWDKSMTHFVLAGKMIEKLYVDISVSPSDVIDSFIV